MLLRTKLLPIISIIFFVASTAKSIAWHRQRIPNWGYYSSSTNWHDRLTLPREETQVFTPPLAKLTSTKANFRKIQLIAYYPNKKKTTVTTTPASGITRKLQVIAKQWGDQIWKFLRWRENRVELDEECCAICLNGYRIDTDNTSVTKSKNAAVMVRRMPRCKHCFHAECLETWLNTAGTCPICRARAPIGKL